MWEKNQSIILLTNTQPSPTATYDPVQILITLPPSIPLMEGIAANPPTPTPTPGLHKTQ